MRIACVQYGNFTEAKRLRDASLPETYSGQRYTVDHFERFVAGCDYMVVSLDAEDHRQVAGRGLLLGMSKPKRLPILPRRLQMRKWGRRVIRELEAFAPTHLLLRCNDVIGCEIVEWANRRRVPVGVAIAVRFEPGHGPSMRFCQLANDPNVVLVANHNRVATRTMIDCGMEPAKAVAWDLPPGIHPGEFDSKPAPANGIRKFLFAGVVSEDKGVPDVVSALDQLRRSGQPVELDVCGNGPLLPRLRRHPGVTQGWLRLHGLVGNERVVRLMRDADLVVVPSRHEFPEGLPFVIQESLAVRTPLLLSDHPVFTSYFNESEGVRFFTGGSAASLATVAADLIARPETYAALSRQTETLWQSIRCPLMWHQVLDQIKLKWAPAAAAPVAAPVHETALV